MLKGGQGAVWKLSGCERVAVTHVTGSEEQLDNLHHFVLEEDARVLILERAEVTRPHFSFF